MSQSCVIILCIHFIYDRLYFLEIKIIVIKKPYHDAKKILLLQKIVIKTAAVLFLGEKKPA
ncbi:hypothetical protein M917_2151 [Psychrobacter aquaticus CMS 56]|uniref:Uncharacterized protein n=1 Tax=Psychrobacter aquaticus CMS 56 TaxID=1354303 RepID=U4T2K7_9GAMM|nr:hypothetical protein M917_2151 [Psychrobacter aquaticus CMS 56]